MVNIRFGAKSVAILLPALRAYGDELGEVISSIEQSAQHAELAPEGYIPTRLTQEREMIQQCLYVIECSQDNHGLFGVPVYPEHGRTIHSALLLRRDDLMARLKLAEGDPLSVPEALKPLQDRLSHMDDEIERVWKDHGVSDLLPELRRRREVKLGSMYPRDIPLEVALATLEGQEIEFIERFPVQAHDLAKEIAAFGSTNPGTILLGVTDDGDAVGLTEAETLAERDHWQNRIEGVSSNSVVPSLVVGVNFENFAGKTIARIRVPKGSQPVYYSNDRPYVRHGSRSRPAQPQEVIDRVRAFLQRQPT